MALCLRLLFQCFTVAQKGQSQISIPEHKVIFQNTNQERVKLDNVYSQRRSGNKGLPQGSLLGLLLFNVYMNDLKYFVQDTSLRLYADDTTAYAYKVSLLVLENLINCDLEIASHWFQKNYLRVNVKSTDNLKILAVTLDSKLSFKPHVSEQLK